MNISTIRCTKGLLKKLKALKVHPRETYEQVIDRLINQRGKKRK